MARFDGDLQGGIATLVYHIGIGACGHQRCKFGAIAFPYSPAMPTAHSLRGRVGTHGRLRGGFFFSGRRRVVVAGEVRGVFVYTPKCRNPPKFRNAQ